MNIQDKIKARECKVQFIIEQEILANNSWTWVKYANEKTINELYQKYKDELTYKNGWRYIVWVGGVDDYYTDYDRAKKHYDEWIEQGYDDVVLLDLQNNKELYNSESIKKNRMDYFKEYYNNKGIK